jgi:cytoskeletal protein CcmA (bactofilin family)
MDLLQRVIGGRLTPHTNDDQYMLDIVVGADATLRGSLVVQGRLRIDGCFEGELDVAGDVVIGRTGRVIAPIKATNVHVSGALRGNLLVQHRVEISETGKVWGDIASPALLIEPGGLFQGQSTMTEADEPLVMPTQANPEG